MSKNIVVVAGPCAVESEQQVWEMGYKISLIDNIIKPYGVSMYFRGGPWKPRTEYWGKSNGQKIKNFEGVREDGLKWMSEIAEKFRLPIVSEVMSEMDIRHFGRYLEPERDYIQIGARTSQAFALLYEIGGTRFGILLKNTQHGVDTKEAQGSLERFLKNRERVYCIRGQKKFIHPDGEDTPEHKAYLEKLLQEPNQHKDARNLNNIKTINTLRKLPYFKDNSILICYDPSHTFGGKTHEVRRKIGESAIKSIRAYGYDWVMVEVDDKSRYAKCDKEQALLTTLNGIDWSQTNIEKEPPEDKKPLTLVDIVSDLIIFQTGVGNGDTSPEKMTKLDSDLKKLQEIRWDMAP